MGGSTPWHTPQQSLSASILTWVVTVAWGLAGRPVLHSTAVLTSRPRHSAALIAHCVGMGSLRDLLRSVMMGTMMILMTALRPVPGGFLMNMGPVNTVSTNQFVQLYKEFCYI